MASVLACPNLFSIASITLEVQTIKDLPASGLLGKGFLATAPLPNSKILLTGVGSGSSGSSSFAVSLGWSYSEIGVFRWPSEKLVVLHSC